ncbi:MAG: plasmid mobilization relaxosome protein MobC [Agriterribacter sp.]
MHNQKTNRTINLNVRLTPQESQQINKAIASSTIRKRSEYVRRKLLDKHITFFTRNKSLDDFMTEMIILRKELNAIANNYNQSVKKLHGLYQFYDLNEWQKEHQQVMSDLVKKMAEIKIKINQINDKWLQS